jgi:ferric-dicitrate binding protein FerR (iron transport regulator)
MILHFLFRKAVTACALTALFTTTSMVALAAPGRIAAELTVSGKVLNGEAPVAYVNGEASKSGRSVFSSSTVSTPEETTAVVSVSTTGRIELDPNSSMSVVFDDKTVDAELASGTLTVLGALGTVSVRTNDGKTTVLNPGESISAEGNAGAKRQSSSNDKAWIWLLVAGGAAAAILIAVTASGNGDDSVVSPNR